MLIYAGMIGVSKGARLNSDRVAILNCQTARSKMNPGEDRASDQMREIMQTALGLASATRHIPPPNPSVGCVITTVDTKVLGRGCTQPTGGPHAEIMGLRDAAEQGHSVQGATAYVTLEPCSHHGRTDPCCDALIAAGVEKVVATNTDPNPLVAGQGFARLRAAGLDVQVFA